ncbi:MAG: low temperature requirement protein A [Actinomycetales bacterium]
MTGRNPREAGRSATPLELLFDLTFVVAFGIAGNEAAHLIADGAFVVATFAYCFAGFGITWAWINFTWFASAFDCDDWLYRVLTMVQMVGVVIFALGLPTMFDSVHHGHMDNTVIVIGYVVMRVPMMLQWARAARQAPQYRAVARGYIISLAVAQLGWIAVLLAHVSLSVFIVCAVVLISVEMAGPLIAEVRLGGTPWHAHHIAERYGLLVIITLGEGVVGTVAALSGLLEGEGGAGWSLEAVLVVIAGVGLTFGMWWMYFSVDHAGALHAAPQRSFGWGYGHIVLFLGAAGVGMGLHVAGYVLAHEAHISNVAAVLSVAIPLAVYTVSLYVLFSLLTRSFHNFHAMLVTLTMVILGAAVFLAAQGVPMGWCLVVTMLAPWVNVIGYETVGHEHQRQVLARMGH